MLTGTILAKEIVLEKQIFEKKTAPSSSVKMKHDTTKESTVNLILTLIYYIRLDT